MACLSLKNPEAAALLLDYTNILGNENAAYYVLSENNGYSLDKAPNGADSELFLSFLNIYNGDEKQAILSKAKVYTKSFREWFGDWIENTSDVSKVIDKNGEPLVVYHTSIADFNTFDINSKNRFSETTKNGLHKKFYFTKSKIHSEQFGISDEEFLKLEIYDHLANDISIDAIAEMYDKTVEEIENIINTNEFNNSKTYCVFLNIKDPFILDANENSISQLNKSDIDKINKSEGSIITNVLESIDTKYLEMLGYDDILSNPFTTDYLVTNPNQIKSATDNEGTFSRKDNNIYHNILLDNIKAEQISTPKDVLRGLASKFHGGFYTLKEYDLLTGESLEDFKKSIRTKLKNIGYIVKEFYPVEGHKGRYRFYPIYTGINNDEIQRSKNRNPQHMEKILNRLKLTFPQIEIHWLDEDEFKTKFVDTKIANKDANSFVIGKTVYLIKGKVTSEIAIEEFLHPLVTCLQYDNYDLFNTFLAEARKKFPTLVKQIKKAYAKFDIDTINNEIVTQALSRYLHKDYIETNYGKNLVSRFIFWMVGKIIEIGNIKILNPKKFAKMKLKDLAEIINSQDVQIYIDDESLDYNIKYNLNKQKECADKMNTLYEKLYSVYSKIGNKTIEQQKKLDKIYEVYNQIKTLHDYSAFNVAASHVLKTIGYINSQNVPSDKDSVIGILHEHKLNGYSTMDVYKLLDLWENNIAFIDEFLKETTEYIYLDDLPNEIRKIVNVIEISAKYCILDWREALNVVTDKLVDEIVEQEYVADNQERRDNVKIVAKDWLHKNAMYGDIWDITKLFGHYSKSSNHIIKYGFHLIQGADTKTLKESTEKMYEILDAYDKAFGDPITRAVTTMSVGSWLKIFMEFDKNGKPTGNFKRDINYGQYNADKEQFMEDLKKYFMNQYGFFYFENDFKQMVRSDTGELAEDEVWTTDDAGVPIQPPYIEWLLNIELWESEHSNKRYTYDYYKERLSVPFDDTKDALGNYNIHTINGHGLSLKTLVQYNKILSNINYYLSKSVDEETGESYPERLSPEHKQKLDYWNEQMKDLASPYNKDGSIKEGDELKMALEISAWQKFIGDKSVSEQDRDRFWKELLEVRKKAADDFLISLNHTPTQDEINHSIILSNLAEQDFIKYNARRGISPEFIEQTLGKLEKRIREKDAIRAEYFKNALMRMINSDDGFSRDLSMFVDNPAFFLDAKRNDIILDQSNLDQQLDVDSTVNENFTFSDVLHITREKYPNGIIHYFLIDRNTGLKYEANDPSAASKTPMSEYDYIMSLYVKQASTQGYINNLIDETTGNPIDFSGYTKHQIYYWLEKNLFTYDHLYINKNGQLSTKKLKLSVFTQMQPKFNQFKDANGNMRPTMTYIPTGRFSTKKSNPNDAVLYFNDAFDHKNNNAIQPKRSLYNNPDFYKMTPALKNLYDVLINTMKEAFRIVYPNADQYQYFLPQIEGSTVNILSRILTNGLESTWNYIKEDLTGILQNDLLFITKETSFVNADGTVHYDVPTRFLKKLKNPEQISTDVTSAVILFMNMAYNFKNKSEVMPKLLAFQNALSGQNRVGEYLKYNKNGLTSHKAFENMLKANAYEQALRINNDQDKPLRESLNNAFVMKLITKAMRIHQVRMLAHGVGSIATGFLDALTKFLRFGVISRYCTLDDLTTSVGTLIKPNVILLLLKNIGRPKPNNKWVAMMQLNGISKSFRSSFSNVRRGRVRYFLNNFLMGGYTFFDYLMNLIVLKSFYHHIRFYDGGVIPTGFYNQLEFARRMEEAGVSKADARWQRVTLRTTLWDAYDFKNGRLFIKPEYEKYVTNTIETNIRSKIIDVAAYINGVNPDNDITQIKTTIIGQCVTTMRNFIVNLIEHNMSHGDDYNVYEIEEGETYLTRGSKIKRSVGKNVKKLTNYELNRSYNLENQDYNPQILLELLYVSYGLCRSLYNAVTGKFSKAKIKWDRTSKMMIKEIFIWFISLYSLCGLKEYTHNLILPLVTPSGFALSDGTRTSNILEFGADFIKTGGMNFINSGDYKYAMDLLASRWLQSILEENSIGTVSELWSNVTALKGGIDSFGNSAYGLFLHVMYYILGMEGNESVVVDPQELVKYGGYRGEPAWIKNISTILGFPKNAHSFFAPNGAYSTTSWYDKNIKDIMIRTGHKMETKTDYKKRIKKSKPSVLNQDIINQIDLVNRNIDNDVKQINNEVDRMVSGLGL